MKISESEMKTLVDSLSNGKKPVNHSVLNTLIYELIDRYKQIHLVKPREALGQYEEKELIKYIESKINKHEHKIRTGQWRGC